MSEPPSAPTYRPLTTVHWAPLGEALAMQGTLEALGFFAFVPDTVMRMLIPHAIGGNSFASAVQVASADAEEIRGILESRGWELPPSARDPPAEPARDRRHVIVEKLGSRIRYGVVLGGILPFFPPATARYFFAGRRVRPRPRWYRLTLLSALYSAVIFVFVSASFLFFFAETFLRSRGPTLPYR